MAFDRMPAVVRELNQILNIKTVYTYYLRYHLDCLGKVSLSFIRYFMLPLVHFSRKHDGSVDIFINYPKSDLTRSNFKASDEFLCSHKWKHHTFAGTT